MVPHDRSPEDADAGSPLKMQRRQYRNPPIVEALCELRFGDETEWDLTVPGRLYEKVKGRYPGKPRQQALLEAEVETSAGPDAPLTVRQGLARIQFPTNDGSRLVAVGPNVLSVHMLRPYTGWDAEFRDQIEEAIVAFAAVVGNPKVDRIGLRYIDRIVFQGEELDIPEFFTIRPPLPASFGNMQALLIRAESTYPDEKTRLVVTFASGEPTDAGASIILDIDVFWLADGAPVALGQAMPLIEGLKLHQRRAFEALITDRAREKFDAT